MRVPKRPLTLTKTEAGVRQAEAAIQAFVRGDCDITITLACAAEGMFDKKGRHFFVQLRDHPTAKNIPRKAWVSHLNRDRDWLKHPSGQDTLEIDRFSATAALIRVMTKLEVEHWTPLMIAFVEWYNGKSH
jgi:hypothetical protein